MTVALVFAGACFDDTGRDTDTGSSTNASDESSDTTQEGDASTESSEGTSGGFVPTEAECPAGSDLTWDSFADDFFETYCRGCHSASVTGEDRMGAPTGFDWDSVAEVQPHAAQIDRLAGANGSIVNDFMPLQGVPGIEHPPTAERESLAEWIACGLPE